MEPFNSRDRRSFIELRQDLSEVLTSAQFKAAIVLEQLLINEQTSDYLRDIMVDSIRANEIFRIIFRGGYGEDEKPNQEPTTAASNITARPDAKPFKEVCHRVTLPKLTNESDPAA